MKTKDKNNLRDAHLLFHLSIFISTIVIIWIITALATERSKGPTLDPSIVLCLVIFSLAMIVGSMAIMVSIGQKTSKNIIIHSDIRKVEIVWIKMAIIISIIWAPTNWLGLPILCDSKAKTIDIWLAGLLFTLAIIITSATICLTFDELKKIIIVKKSLFLDDFCSNQRSYPNTGEGD